MRILGVGDGRSIIFLRWAWRLAERGHEVHVRLATGSPTGPASSTASPRTTSATSGALMRVKGCAPLRLRAGGARARRAARGRPRPRPLPAAVRLVGGVGGRAPARPLAVEHGHLHVRPRPPARAQARAEGDRGRRRVRRLVARQRGGDDPARRAGRQGAPHRLVRGPAPVRPASTAIPGCESGSAGRRTRSSSSRCGTTGRTRTSTCSCARSPARRARCPRRG